MNEKDKSLEVEQIPAEIELDLEEFELNPISSAEMLKPERPADEIDSLAAEENSVETAAAADEQAEEVEETAKIAEPETEDDPVFKELAEPKLPELARENRARLQMQSPNRIYFYWSLKNNPFQTLQKIFGGQTSYQLIVKLVNQKNGTEEVHPVEATGNWWFEVDADSHYQAEIGFYAPNRPYFRVLFSNVIETPRKNPSTRLDYTADFAIDAKNFAEVLKNSGFRQDAFEVALAGDDIDYADFATKKAFSHLTGKEYKSNDDLSELRFALLALASGYTLEDLRGKINPTLFALLSESAANLSAEQTFSVLQENFEVIGEEFIEEDEELLTPTVFGASLINFPRISRKRRLPKKILSKIEPVSSFK